MFSGKFTLHKRYLSLLISFILITGFMGVFSSVAPVKAADMDRPGWTMVWNDEFGGTTLDRTKWDPWWPDETGYYIHPGVSKYGFNPDNASVSNGTLKLKYSKDQMTIGNKTVQYSAGNVTSKFAPYSFKYGYIEARMNLNNLGGAFWLLPDEGHIDRGGLGSEVDIMECYDLGYSWGYNQIDNAFHWNGYTESDPAWFYTPYITEGWHKYAIEWDPDAIKFYYDDKLVRIKYGEGIPQGFQHIVFNSGNGPDEMLPANCEVDYVRVYRKNGTTQEPYPLDYYGEYTVNPGFETGNKNGWEGYGTWDVINSNQRTGGFCARVASGSAAEQVITGLTQGKTYTVTAYVKVDGGTAWLGIKDYDILYSSKQMYTTTASTSYARLSFTVKAGIYSRTAKIYLWKPDGGYAYIDDFEVKEEPNLCLDKPASASSMHSMGEEAQCAVDGNEFNGNQADNAATKWCSTDWTGSPEWLQADLRSNKTINRWVVVHAGAIESWGTQSVNTRDFSLQYSTNGTDWSTADSVTGNIDKITDRTFTPVTARYVRLYITKPQTETTYKNARIYEFKVYPQTVTGAVSKPVVPSPSWRSAPAPLTNLVTNPSFETGNLTGWGGYGTRSVVSGSYGSGSYCVRISPDSAAEQTINNLSPNTTYVLSGAILCSNDFQDKAYLGVKEHGGAEQMYAIRSYSTWGPYDVIFTTGPGNTSATVYVWSPAANSSYVFGDSISVRKLNDLTKINDSQTGTGVNSFEKVGSWSAVTGEAGSYYGDHSRSNSTNDYYQVRFVGTKASLYATKDSNGGIAAVSLDGSAETDVDMYSAAKQSQTLVYTSPDLPYGQHTLKVRVKGTKNSSSGGYYADGDMVLVTHDRITINDNTTGSELSQFYYSGTWSQVTGDNTALNSDYRMSATANNYYQVQFNGTIVKLYATTDSNCGIAAVSIDNGPETDIDLYSATKNGQVLVYTSPALSPKIHTIKVRVKGAKNAGSSGYNICADRLDVFQ